MKGSCGFIVIDGVRPGTAAKEGVMDEHRPDERRGENGGLSPSGDAPDAVVSPSMMEAEEAFLRDLPHLLKERPGEWVGYHGSDRIGFALTKDLMYLRCLDRGLERDEIAVRCIEPMTEELIFGLGGTWDLFTAPTLNPPDAFVSPSMLDADEAFRRDLPQLLKERPGEWVGYHGSDRIGFATTKAQMYRECLERGLKRGEFFVTCVEPEEHLLLGPAAILGMFLGGQE